MQYFRRPAIRGWYKKFVRSLENVMDEDSLNSNQNHSVHEAIRNLMRQCLNESAQYAKNPMLDV